MPLLFSYGTLQEEPVQLAVFGRRLEGQRDTLLGFELTQEKVQDADFVEQSGKAMHKMLQYTGDQKVRVDGMVFEVTTDELRIADDYEPEPWQRVVAHLASGRQAWVYADSRCHPTGP